MNSSDPTFETDASFLLSCSGLIYFFSLPTPPLSPIPHLDQPLSLSRATNNFRVAPGRVTSLSWTPDGYALAVGWERGWGVWSTGGKLLGWGVLHGEDAELLGKEDSFMRGVERRGLLWAGGGLELIILSSPTPPPSLNEVLFRREWKTSKQPSSQLFTLPFAKSSFTTLPTPSSTLYPLLLLSTKLLLSPTASLPSSSYLSSITPSSSLWLPISLPHAYITVQYPIRYATVSEDGRLVAVAGRRGLTHWSKGSGRWKLFEMAEWEENFRVRGGMVWFLHVLVAGVEEGKDFSVSRSIFPSSSLLVELLTSSSLHPDPTLLPRRRSHSHLPRILDLPSSSRPSHVSPRQLPARLHGRQHVLPFPHRTDGGLGRAQALWEHFVRRSRRHARESSSHELVDSSCSEE